MIDVNKLMLLKREIESERGPVWPVPSREFRRLLGASPVSSLGEFTELGRPHLPVAKGVRTAQEIGDDAALPI